MAKSFKTSAVQVFAFAAVVCLFFAFCVTSANAADSSKTLANLQAAYNGESNAKAKYLEYAKKADSEGFGQAASLFRAAARSEEVHIASYEKLIKALKGTPKADIKKVAVKSTKENIKDAIKGEMTESVKIYPDFAKQAEADKNDKAKMVFLGVAKVEGGHVDLYKDALANLKKGPAKEYIVCTVCGYVTADLTLKKCPVCSHPREDFVSVK
ncbi:MAG: hypothetical protein LWY06_17685 [Firmicutes bacterium]|nr:hypothetical protein [Bacillota bacterium]